MGSRGQPIAARAGSQQEAPHCCEYLLPLPAHSFTRFVPLWPHAAWQGGGGRTWCGCEYVVGILVISIRPANKTSDSARSVPYDWWSRYAVRKMRVIQPISHLALSHHHGCCDAAAVTGESGARTRNRCKERRSPDAPGQDRHAAIGRTLRRTCLRGRTRAPTQRVGLGPHPTSCDGFGTPSRPPVRVAQAWMGTCEPTSSRTQCTHGGQQCQMDGADQSRALHPSRTPQNTAGRPRATAAATVTDVASVYLSAASIRGRP